MKILYHHRIASKDGQYVHIEEIVKSLTALGHQVIIAAPKVSENAKFGSDGGIVSWVRKKIPRIFAEMMEFAYAFYVFIKLSFYIIKHKPDAIYERYNLFLPAGIWAKKLFNLPLILEVNSPLYEERKQYGGLSLKKLAKWSERYTWTGADHLCAVTAVLAEYLLTAGVLKQKISVIANGTDQSKFYPSHQSLRRAPFQDKLVVGFVGFCREWHQLDKVLELIAMSNNEKLLLLIVGEGPASQLLKQKAKQLKLENALVITGIVERDAMPNWLDQIDIALQPAVTPWASPLKLIEYLAKGKVIIAPDSKNIKELLCDDKNALLYPSENPAAILPLIEKIVQSKSLREKLSQGAINTIKDKKLTWSENAQRIERLFLVLNNSCNVPIEKDSLS